MSTEEKHLHLKQVFNIKAQLLIGFFYMIAQSVPKSLWAITCRNYYDILYIFIWTSQRYARKRCRKCNTYDVTD